MNVHYCAHQLAQPPANLNLPISSSVLFTSGLLTLSKVMTSYITYMTLYKLNSRLG